MRLYGKNSVLEKIKSSPRSIEKVYVQEDHVEAGYIFKKGKQFGFPVIAVPKSKIQKLARNLNTQGILAEVEDFTYVPYPDLLESALREKGTLVFLDSLNDPQNLGGIVRSLACLGGFSIVLPTHDSVEVTDAVLRVACGGDNYVKIAKVSNLSQAMSSAREAGFWIAASVVKDGEDITKVQMNFPLGLVVGSEDKGVREVLLKQVDLKITIPMSAVRLSLNAAHATTLLCYEIFRQRQLPQII